MEELMTTREVAEYLRLKERKIYDLVAARSIPCTRITGKWLFPKALIDLWIMDNTDCSPMLKNKRQTLPVIVGSYDPLLEWAVQESGCELALLFNGVADGLQRLLERKAVACGVHVVISSNGNGHDRTKQLQNHVTSAPCVALEWAKRQQGLALALGNPLDIQSVANLVERKARLIARRQETDVYLYLHEKLQQLGHQVSDLQLVEPAASTDADVAAAVLSGKADAGIIASAIAQQYQLTFLPLVWERYEIILERREFFEIPFQRLMAFAKSQTFSLKLKELSGYDTDNLGAVTYNAP